MLKYLQRYSSPPKATNLDIRPPPCVMLTDSATKHVRFVHVAFIAVIILGFASWRLMAVQVYPDSKAFVAAVSTVWPGAPAEDIEERITPNVELQLGGIAGIRHFESESTLGHSLVTIFLDESSTSASVDETIDSLRRAAASVQNLPAGAQSPQVYHFKPHEQMPLLRIAVQQSGASEMRQLFEVTEALREQLNSLEGVASVSTHGASAPTMEIRIDPVALEDNGLSLQQVIATLREYNLTVPSGSLSQQLERYTVQFDSRQKDFKAFDSILLKRRTDGTHLSLGDIAELTEHASQQAVVARSDTTRCNLLYVVKRADADAIRVRDLVVAELNSFSKDLPDDCSVRVVLDITPWVTTALATLWNNLLYGCVIVFAVLTVSLGLRNSILAILGLPFSYLATMLVLKCMGIDLSTPVIFALVIVSGVIVDDAIVMLENVHRHVSQGADTAKAISLSIREIAIPVTSATLTTVFGFLPILFLQGQVADLFGKIPIVVSVALLASLIECFVILPAHLLKLSHRSRILGSSSSRPDSQSRRSTRLASRVKIALSSGFGQLINAVLSWRYAVLLCVVVSAVAVGLHARRIRQEFLPNDFPMALVSFSTNTQATLEKSDQICLELAKALRELTGPGKLLKNSLSVAGLKLRNNRRALELPQCGLLWLQFNPSPQHVDELTSQIREILEKVRLRSPELGIVELTVGQLGAVEQGSPSLKLRIVHPDFTHSYQVAQQLMEKLNKIPGVVSIQSNVDAGPLQIQLRPLYPTCDELGVSRTNIANTLAAAVHGIQIATVGTSTTTGSVPVLLRAALDRNDSLTSLLSLRVESMLGLDPRIRDVAEVEYTQEFANLPRFNGRRFVEVSATLAPNARDSRGNEVDLPYLRRAVANLTAEVQQEHPGVQISLDGEIAEQSQSTSRLLWAGLFGVLLIYLTLVAVLNSYLQPFIVLLSVVFGAIGAFAGLTIHDQAFSVVNAVALVALSGVAVNDAILLVDFINKSQPENEIRKSIVLGCRLRIRPILITTFTTLAGLLPMAMGIGGSSQLWSPFATTYCYGLAATTGLTIVCIPALYMILDDISKFSTRQAIL
ncbi:MAG: efflux RND transporter permease subunit [Planctomycetales bacterium]|nr:efflux RND transporter permease subunit [Planctomycetales bacterium]